jgi:hypothetical protein
VQVVSGEQVGQVEQKDLQELLVQVVPQEQEVRQQSRRRTREVSSEVIRELYVIRIQQTQ